MTGFATVLMSGLVGGALLLVPVKSPAAVENGSVLDNVILRVGHQLKGGASEPRFSFVWERVAVQILFSDRVLLRFLYAFKADQIDVGVLIVDSKNKLGRIATDLIWLRSTLTLPLWVIALK